MAKLTARMDARPSFQFYPQDYLGDPGLGVCSLAAQGLWVRIFLTMWLCNPRGKLVVAGRPMTDEEIDRRPCRQSGHSSAPAR